MANIIGSAVADILSGSGLADLIDGLGGNDTIDSGQGNDTLSGGDGDDVILGGAGDDQINGDAGNDDLRGQDGNDRINGGNSADKISGGAGNDVLNGDGGDDQINGGSGNDRINGNTGFDEIYGAEGNDKLFGGDGADLLYGGRDNDTLEGGAGNDELRGGGGNDHLLAFSWGGEPVPEQDATAQVNTDEPIEDNDLLIGGSGSDTFEFWWLLDAKDEIIAKHTDESGDIDYSGNGVAGENDNVHDHWVETIGVKTVADYNAAQDTLVFKDHTVQLGSATYQDVNNDGEIDTVLSFVSNQPNGGAHDNDEVGTVILLGAEVDADDINVDAGVFYGVEEPWSALG